MKLYHYDQSAFAGSVPTSAVFVWIKRHPWNAYLTKVTQSGDKFGKTEQQIDDKSGHLNHTLQPTGTWRRKEKTNEALCPVAALPPAFGDIHLLTFSALIGGQTLCKSL